MSKPIRPDEVTSLKAQTLPDEVFDVFNAAIAKHWDGRSATFTQDEVVAALAEKLSTSREDLYARKLLDVEDVYRAAGWSVEYNRPGYNETYRATFTFSRRKERGKAIAKILAAAKGNI